MCSSDLAVSFACSVACVINGASIAANTAPTDNSYSFGGGELKATKYLIGSATYYVTFSGNLTLTAYYRNIGSAATATFINSAFIIEVLS